MSRKFRQAEVLPWGSAKTGNNALDWVKRQVVRKAVELCMMIFVRLDGKHITLIEADNSLNDTSFDNSIGKTSGQ
jgi:hypothetical protein